MGCIYYPISISVTAFKGGNSPPLFQLHDGLLGHFLVNVAVAIECAGVLDVTGYLRNQVRGLDLLVEVADEDDIHQLTLRLWDSLPIAFYGAIMGDDKGVLKTWLQLNCGRTTFIRNCQRKELATSSPHPPPPQFCAKVVTAKTRELFRESSVRIYSPDAFSPRFPEFGKGSGRG